MNKQSLKINTVLTWVAIVGLALGQLATDRDVNSVLEANIKFASLVS